MKIHPAPSAVGLWQDGRRTERTNLISGRTLDVAKTIHIFAPRDTMDIVRRGWVQDQDVVLIQSLSTRSTDDDTWKRDKRQWPRIIFICSPVPRFSYGSYSGPLLGYGFSRARRRSAVVLCKCARESLAHLRMLHLKQTASSVDCVPLVGNWSRNCE